MLKSQDILDMLNQGYTENEVAEAVSKALNDAIESKRKAEAKKAEAKSNRRDAIREIFKAMGDYIQTYHEGAIDPELFYSISDKECDEIESALLDIFKIYDAAQKLDTMGLFKNL